MEFFLISAHLSPANWPGIPAAHLLPTGSMALWPPTGLEPVRMHQRAESIEPTGRFPCAESTPHARPRRPLDDGPQRPSSRHEAPRTQPPPGQRPTQACKRPVVRPTCHRGEIDCPRPYTPTGKPARREKRARRPVLDTPPSKHPALPDPLMGRYKTNKSSQGRADAQRLVATRLLDRLHDPLGHFSRLQRIYPRAR
jgi:hypothetical protein